MNQLVCAPAPSADPDPTQSSWPCPLCGAGSRRAFARHEYWISDCDACQHRFAEFQPPADHAESVYGDDYFAGGGAGYDNYLAEAVLLRSHGRRYGRLLRRFVSPGRVLDVGTAAGFVLQGMVDAGWSGRGIEPNARMAEFARRELGLDVYASTLESFAGEERFDLVTMIQVVAHYHDVRWAFERAAELTRPGGFWLVETWNRSSWTARLLGRHWHEYSPPSVLHWFSPGVLERFAARFGMQPVARGRPAKWLNGGHAKSLLQYKLGDSLWGRLASLPLALLPDRLPIPYPAEDLFWALYRKAA